MANTPQRSFRCSDAVWLTVTERAALQGVAPADIVREALDALLATDIPKDSPERASARERERVLQIIDSARDDIVTGRVLDLTM